MDINPDIRKAKTLEGSFYSSTEIYGSLLEKAFVPSWQWIGDSDALNENGFCLPFELLPGSLNEPLLLVRDHDAVLRCMSNVCTHRGKIMVEQAGKMRNISCGYHGRCFHLDGQFKSMPEFKETEDFPGENDHLPKLPLKNLGVFLFTSLAAGIDFESIFAPIQERLFWFPFDQLKFDAQASESYSINAHWALYCDNYLEGFHVPFVHPGLGANLDYSEYSTEIFEYCNLQLGVADAKAAAFDLPKDSKDYGKRIHAYYWWIFPNLMLNVYTWGVSVNVVEPMGVDSTKVRFYTYLLPGQESAAFSKEMLHQTEMEDEDVVHSVQKGLKSRLYKHGRFSPTREQGVHHFHRLLANIIK
jgi:choline monooxygenase